MRRSQSISRMSGGENSLSLCKIVEHAQTRFGLDLRPQLFAPRLVDAHPEARLRNAQDRLAAAAHQEHEGRGDRHAAAAVPGDAVAPLGGRMEMLGGGDRLLEGRRIFDPVLLEQVHARREQFDRAVDRHAELLAAPRAHRPDGGVEVERGEAGGLDVVVERNDELFLHRLAEPRRIDRDDVVFRNRRASAFSISRSCSCGSLRRSKFLREAMLLRKSAHMLRIDRK